MKYDIFISYRRKDTSGNIAGRDIARGLKHYFRSKGFTCFFDYSECTDGEFEQTIISAVRNSKFFLLVMTKGALDRCVEEGDWVRREIAEAIEHGLKIIPISITDNDHPNISFDGEMPTLPYPLDRIKKIEWSEISMGSLYEDSVDKLIKNRLNNAENARIEEDEVSSMKDDKAKRFERGGVVKKELVDKRVEPESSVRQSDKANNNMIQDLDGLILETSHQQSVYKEFLNILDQYLTEQQYLRRTHYNTVDYLTQLNNFCLKYENDKEVRSIYLAAKKELNKGKKEEISIMLQNSSYDAFFLFQLIEKKVFSIKELNKNGVAPLDVLTMAYDNKSLSHSHTTTNCESYQSTEATDVFFWGVPRAGHTSIIASLLFSGYSRGELISVNGYRLQNSIRYGLQVQETPKGDPIVFDGRYQKSRSFAHVNFIDYSGSDFLDIVNDMNSNIGVLFENVMGKTPCFLQSNNKKILFLLIDPTYMNSLGNVDQQMILHQFLGKLGHRENHDFMQHICGLHVIVTKSDVLNEGDNVLAKCNEITNNMTLLMEDLRNLCCKWRISNPTIHSFSLGNFYHCGLFCFSDKDAIELNEVIMKDIDQSTSKMSKILRRLSQ